MNSIRYGLFLAALSFTTAAVARNAGGTVQDYAQTMNRIFVHDGVGVTIGPDDGRTLLVFNPFVLSSEGSAVAPIKRFDRDGTPQWQDYELKLRPGSAGAIEIALRKPGAEKELTYAVKKVDDTHVNWFNDVVSPFKNEYTEGKWEIEVGAFDIYLDEAGRTAYTIADEKYYLKDDYVAQHYTVVTPDSGSAFLRDNATGEQVSFRSEEMHRLVETGVVDAPVSKTYYWKQLNP